jgi:cytidylate kinase
MRSVVIAIDGTAACGKGTIARMLAKHYGFAHLDSGALYRLVAMDVLDQGGDPSNPEHAVRTARAIDPSRVNDPRLRSAAVGEASSRVAPIPGVRAAIFEFQRAFATHPPQAKPGAVIDGRDIGTVIAPDAAAKLFVDARPQVRAERRYKELKAEYERAENPLPLPDIRTVMNDLMARDERDRSRAVAPLRQASDAVLLDTSDLDIDAAFAAAFALVDPKVKAALAARPRG